MASCTPVIMEASGCTTLLSLTLCDMITLQLLLWQCLEHCVHGQSTWTQELDPCSRCSQWTHGA